MCQLNEIELDEFDALAIPGGFEETNFYEDAFSEEFLNVIRTFDRQNKPIACVCVAGLVVAKSGALKDRYGTTYHFEKSLRQKQMREMGVQVKHNERIVEDRNIITSSSPETALDVAFCLLEKLTNENNTREVRRKMGFTY